MDVMDLLQSLFRWLHVVFGIIWIGLLYFFNFVNAPFQATMDGETKKKVNPELLPRALFWFRMGAAMTWLTGILLLLLVFYHGGAAFEGGQRSLVGVLVGLGIVLASPFVYDALVKSVLKELQTAFFGAVIIAIVLMYVFQFVGGFSARGFIIHMGGTFGTIMAYNVWFKIWPAQKAIITAVKAGTPPDAALVSLAGVRSRHNTYMSVPLVFFMLDQHNVGWASNPIVNGVMVLVGFGLVYYLYDASAKVKGF